LFAAPADAPDAPGVYFFLDARRELLYIGKATSLRTRLAQHRAAKSPGVRLDLLYQQVAEIRWHALASEALAAAREADLIVALRPAFNAALADQGRWNYVAVEPRGDKTLRFALSPAGGKYGCFPHLGRGLSSPPGIACCDGYAALLRLLWSASSRERDRLPARLTRGAPDSVDLAVDETLRAPLHAFLSGTSTRLLSALPAPSDAYLAPALTRDRAAAREFYTFGPHAIRALRLRHGERRGPIARDRIEALLADELRDQIGPFELPRPRETSDRLLGRRSHPWATEA
jgi:hypothetical protein